jgi:hypothetical protein
MRSQQFQLSECTFGIESAPIIADAAKWVHIEPIRMQALTVIGEDPYASEQAIPRARSRQ